jgi:hypothetical protein
MAELNARTVLEALVGEPVTTLTGRPNVVIGLAGDDVRVGTTRSRKGQLVPIAWVQDALDRLAAERRLEISVESVGYRSAFIGAVLSSLPNVEASPPL